VKGLLKTSQKIEEMIEDPKPETTEIGNQVTYLVE
jgi:hypothetical protein